MAAHRTDSCFERFMMHNPPHTQQSHASRTELAHTSCYMCVHNHSHTHTKHNVECLPFTSAKFLCKNDNDNFISPEERVGAIVRGVGEDDAGIQQLFPSGRWAIAAACLPSSGAKSRGALAKAHMLCPRHSG